MNMPGPRALVEVVAQPSDGQHTIVISLAAVTQCLTCGYWTKGPPAALNSVPCRGYDEDVPLEDLEAKL